MITFSFCTVFLSCNSAFEQGHLELWRYINAFIIIIIIRIIAIIIIRIIIIIMYRHNCVVQLLGRLLNSVLKTEKMPSQWKRSILVNFLTEKEIYRIVKSTAELNFYRTALIYGKGCMVKIG